MNFFKNNFGFSLIELSVAMGLLGGVSLLTMKLMADQTANEAYIRGRSEIADTANTVAQALSKPDNCRYAFRELDLSDLMPLFDTTDEEVRALEVETINLPLPNPGEEVELIRPNSIYPTFRTAEIFLERSNRTPAFPVHLVMNFVIKNLNPQMWGPVNPDEINEGDRIVTERIPLNLSVDENNLIQSCSPRTAETNLAAKRKFCLSLGNSAEWDESVDPPACRLRERVCPAGQIPKQQQSLGDFTCVKIEDQINLSDLIDQTSCTITAERKFQLKQVGNKIRLECVGGGSTTGGTTGSTTGGTTGGGPCDGMSEPELSRCINCTGSGGTWEPSSFEGCICPPPTTLNLGSYKCV